MSIIPQIGHKVKKLEGVLRNYGRGGKSKVTLVPGTDVTFDEIRPASAVNPCGKIVGDLEGLKKVVEGEDLELMGGD